jgi:hypothetical protein
MASYLWETQCGYNACCFNQRMSDTRDNDTRLSATLRSDAC